MSRKIIKTRDLSGLNIYQDPKRGTIFYDIFTQRGFILTSSDVKTYTVYSSMLPLSFIVAFAITSLFRLDYIATIIIFLVIYAAVMILFRVNFFYKLPEAENWKPFKRENIFVWMATNFSRSRLIMLLLMLIALSVLMPLNAYLEKAEGINLYGTYAVTAVTIVGAIITVIALIKKIRNEY